MEWLNLCGLLSRKATDPANQIAWGILGGTIGFLGSTGTLAVLKPEFTPLPAVIAVAGYQAYLTYMLPAAPNQSKYLVLKSKRAKRYRGMKIPSGELTQLYMADELDFKMDVLEAMEHSREFCHWSVTWSQMWYNLIQLFPNANNFTLRNKANSKKEIADHYDRGNDFFRAFLGPRMKYTSAIFNSPDCSLEEAQDNKMATICRKLRLKAGMRMLDIGCGWGTLAGYAHRVVGAEASGVTLSDEGAAWARSHNPGPDFIISDYRDMPEDPSNKFQAISCIEMAEHVGLENFQKYMAKIDRLLTDDGTFLMQVAGLRKGADHEDMAWGLLMNRYIFPGASASTPLHWYIEQVEKAGFEVESVENIGVHYSLTLNQWYKNFIRDSPSLPGDKYPESIIRLWKLFLSWSTLASKRGSATCYQIVAHKGTRKFDKFDRAKMMHTVGPIKGIEKLSYDEPDQYGAIIDEQQLWNKGPFGSTAVFEKGSNSIEVGYPQR